MTNRMVTNSVMRNIHRMGSYAITTKSRRISNKRSNNDVLLLWYELATITAKNVKFKIVDIARDFKFNHIILHPSFQTNKNCNRAVTWNTVLYKRSVIFPSHVTKKKTFFVIITLRRNNHPLTSFRRCQRPTRRMVMSVALTD